MPDHSLKCLCVRCDVLGILNGDADNVVAQQCGLAAIGAGDAEDGDTSFLGSANYSGDASTDGISTSSNRQHEQSVISFASYVVHKCVLHPVIVHIGGHLRNVWSAHINPAKVHE